MAKSTAINGIKRRLYSRKVTTFLICLVIASFLWLIHALNRNYKYTLNVPVRFVNLPSNRAIVGELPEQLQFDIKTSGLKLFFILLKRDFNELTIDFASLKSNRKFHTYSISTGNFNLANAIRFDVEILKVRPDTLFFNIKKGLTKSVPLQLRMQLKCAPGYTLSSAPKLSLQRVTISGDSASVKACDTVYTALLLLNELQQNYSATLALRKNDSDLYYSAAEVQVGLTVDKITENTLTIPLNALNVPPRHSLKLFPDRVTIKYIVSQQQYDQLDANSFRATVDYLMIDRKSSKAPVQLLKVPQQVKIIEIAPKEVEYLIHNN